MPSKENPAPLAGGNRADDKNHAVGDEHSAADHRPQVLHSWDDVHRLTDDLGVMAIWRDDLEFKIARARIAQQTIGLSDERLDALAHEVRCFTRVAYKILERS